MTGPRPRERHSIFVVALLCPFAAAGAAAQQACGQFAWSSNGRIDLFAEYKPILQSGDALPAPGVFSVALRPRADVIYPVKSESARDEGYGGIVTIVNIPAGRYRIALSSEARIDAVQLHRPLPSRAVAYDPACPGEHRSVEITAADGPLTLQIDNARTSRMTVAVYRRWFSE